MALIEKLKNIANAICLKTNKTEELTLEQMASAIGALAVGEFDLVSKGLSIDVQNEMNTHLKDLIDYSIEANKNLETTTTWSKDKRLLFLTADMKNATNVNNFLSYKMMFYVKEFDFSNVTSAAGFGLNSTFMMKMPSFFNLHKCTAISFQESLFEYFPDNITINCGDYADTPTYLSLHGCFQYVQAINKSSLPIKLTLHGDRCNKLSCFLFVSGLAIEEFEYLDSHNITTLINFSMNGPRIDKIYFGSLEKCTDFTYMIGNRNPKTLHFTRWKQADINFKSSIQLPLENIKYIIWHALNGANTLGYEDEGATSRTLQLHATLYASWEEWKTTKPSVEDCEFLGIDETEITKYGELTWEDIALNVKLITIAK